MKDIFCVAIFASKALGFIVFVSVLRPDSIGSVQTSMRSAYCKIERSRAQGCDLNASAAASNIDWKYVQRALPRY
jgi:hypothetical protein